MDFLLLGLIILSRRLYHPWDLVVGVVLVIIGLMGSRGLSL